MRSLINEEETYKNLRILKKNFTARLNSIQSRFSQSPLNNVPGQFRVIKY